ncbi:MAG: hypothetical protein Q7R34_06305, partial [Dehalococcoidia bacterium]|nr:hypothetical protein [Dehalococcoidia bacterium]
CCPPRWTNPYPSRQIKIERKWTIMKIGRCEKHMEKSTKHFKVVLTTAEYCGVCSQVKNDDPEGNIDAMECQQDAADAR